MDPHANKIQEPENKADARKFSEKENEIEGTFQFIDERPEGIAQRELQDTINNNPRTVQLLTIQQLVNNSPRIKQLKAIQEVAYNGRWGQQAVQLQAMATHRAMKTLQRTGLEEETPVQKKENNTGLPDNLKSGIEHLSGYAMDDVKVHYNSDKPAQLNAHAYAQGTTIHLASGQEKHLPHETWHVVQQKQGRVQPTKQLKDKTTVNDDEGLEKEADEMGAKATTYNIGTTATTPKTPIASFTSTFNYGNNVIQGKFGVEYETKWTIDDADNVTANHKKKVFQGDGFHIESDNNDLEFVSMPPSDTPKALYDTVGRMKTKATSMIGNLRGNVEQPAPAGPFLKDDVEELLAAMELGEGTHKLRAVIEHITEGGAVTEGHIDHLAGKLHEEGWLTGAEVESADTIKGYDWEVTGLKGYITKAHFDGNLTKKPPAEYEWEASNSLNTLLETEAMGSFNGKNILVPDEEETMKARPQFTFGVKMKDIPKLFKMFIDGPKGRDEDAQRELNYGSGAKEKLEDYGKAKIGPGLEAGNTKAKGIFEANSAEEAGLDDKSIGFIHYLVYYINQMRTKEWASKGTTVQETKSVHIAQVLLGALKDEADSRFPIDNDAYTAGMKHIVLTGEDETGIQSDAALNESLTTALERGNISTAQKTKLSEYLETNLAKMKDDPVYPKHFFVLMNRSGFDRMYDSLEAEQKGLVNTYMETKVIPEFLIDEHEDETLFKSPYYYKKKTGADSYERGLSYGPSLKEWWNSIKSAEQRQNITGEDLDDTTSKRDKLSPPSEFIDHTGKPDETQSLGSLNKMDGNLAVIELREWGNVMPAASWQEHTSDMLKAFAKNILGEVPDWDTD